MTQTSDDQDVLAEIVRRIVTVADPDKIILFGSRARGEAGADSDYDILVIGPSAEDYWRRNPPLYGALLGLAVPKDVVWWTPEELECWADTPGHYVREAVREGRVIYERAA